MKSVITLKPTAFSWCGKGCVTWTKTILSLECLRCLEVIDVFQELEQFLATVINISWMNDLNEHKWAWLLQVGIPRSVPRHSGSLKTLSVGPDHGDSQHRLGLTHFPAEWAVAAPQTLFSLIPSFSRDCPLSQLWETRVSSDPDGPILIFTNRYRFRICFCYGSPPRGHVRGPEGLGGASGSQSSHSVVWAV